MRYYVAKNSYDDYVTHQTPAQLHNGFSKLGEFRVVDLVSVCVCGCEATWNCGLVKGLGTRL